MRTLFPAFAACLLLALGAGRASAEAITAERMLAGATSILNVNDIRWLDKEAGRTAAALGQDPGRLRSALARALFGCRSLSCIDLSRPALIARRPGAAPLMVVLPITDRRAFIEQFGADPDAPLIRTGERDGTVVFTQNAVDGMYEYRVMIGNGVAVLARSAAECRALLAATPLRAASSAPLTLTMRNARPAPVVMPGLPAALASAAAMLNQIGDGFASQVAEMRFELRPDGEDGLAVAARVRCQPDSLLAVWTGNQRNQPSRLLPLVRTPSSAITIAGDIAWQGLGERLGATLGALRPHPAGAETADDSWTALWSLLDRSGAFAIGVDLVPGERMGIETRMLLEHRRAPDLLTAINAATIAAGGTAGQPQTLAGFPAFRWAAAQVDGGSAATVAATTIAVATDRHLVQVQSTQRPAEQLAADLTRASLGSGMPEAINAVLMISLDAVAVARAVAPAAQADGEPAVTNAVTTLALRTGQPNELLLDLRMPHLRVAALLNRSHLPVPLSDR
jgi:hypothetical protein